MKANRLAALALTIDLVACAVPRAPAPAPVPAPTLLPAPIATPVTPAPDWRDAALTPGDWSWSAVSGRSTASYGTAGAAPVLTFTCDANAGTVVLARSGPTQAPVPMVVTTTTMRRVLNGVPTGGDGAAVSATITARDPLLDAIAFSDGRFMVEASGYPPAIAPSWPEVSRVIEDCRG